MNYRERQQLKATTATILFVVCVVCALVAVWTEVWQWGATASVFLFAAFIAFLATQ
jgi:hypothetical protein